MTGSASNVNLSLETVDSDCSVVFAKDQTGSQTLHSNVGLKFDAFSGHLTVRKDVISNDGFLHLKGNNGGDIHTAGGSDGIAVIQNTTNNGKIRIASKSSGGADVTIASFDVDGSTPILRCDGDIVAFNSSDMTLKENISPIKNALKMVNSLSGNTFAWKSGLANKGMDTGIIAQEIEALGLPGITATRSDGTKGVRYDRLIPVLVEAVKELTAKVNYLENK